MAAVQRITHAGEPPNLVSVPTHFYKVVLGECKQGPEGGGEGAGKVAIAAFVMPNAPIDPEVWNSTVDPSMSSAVCKETREIPKSSGTAV